MLAGLKWSHSCSEGGAMIRKWSSYHAMKSLILEIFLLICTGDLLSLAGIIEEFLQSKHEIPCTQWNQSYAYSLSVSLSREVSVVMRSWQEDSYLVTWQTHAHTRSVWDSHITHQHSSHITHQDSSSFMVKVQCGVIWSRRVDYRKIYNVISNTVTYDLQLNWIIYCYTTKGSTIHTNCNISCFTTL